MPSLYKYQQDSSCLSVEHDGKWTAICFGANESAEILREPLLETKVLVVVGKTEYLETNEPSTFQEQLTELAR